MTTVISVNQSQESGSEHATDQDPDTSGRLKPDPPNIARTNSNRSTSDAKDNILKGKKLGHRRVKDGEVTYKKFQTTQLMGSIQLGIQQSVGNLGCQEDRDLLHEDFYTVETVVFSRDGTLQKTPAHNYSQFKFRTFAPLAFRKFRNIFGIERDKFLISLCAEPMIELSNPGASGSIFYVTQDDEIICKTVSHKESKFLQEILPAYYLNLHQNIRTLLPKFFGFFCYSCNTKNVRIICMKNLLPSGLQMHHKFDLKGSTHKREADRKERSKANPTFKDNDFTEMYPEGISLQPELYNSLFDTIERDCRALESLKIMDYSFLMGIHNLDQPRKPLMMQMSEKLEHDHDSVSMSEEWSGDVSRHPGLERVGSVQQRERLIAHSTALESITAEVDVEVVADHDESEIAEMCSTWGGIPAKNHKGENLLLFIGIIDVLQSYGVAKKLEHTLKSFVYDGDKVSVHRPAFYARRFKNFLSEKVFKKMPPNLKPALSIRRPFAPLAPRRLTSKEGQHEQTSAGGAGAGAVSGSSGSGDKTRVERMSTDNSSVTVITIGATADHDNQSGAADNTVLPSVLRDKPRTSTSGQKPRVSGRPDVADVEGAACTPPPDLGGVTSDDERIQIYVPSPQSTPYSTISRHVADTHKNITHINYKPDSPDSQIVSVVYNDEETPRKSLQNEELEQPPVSLSHIEVDLQDQHEDESCQ